MSKFKVVASDGMAKDGAAILEKNPSVDFQLHKGVAPTEIPFVLKDADFVIIRSATTLKRDVLEKLPQLKGVLRAGVGIDNIDLKAAESLGIWVWNAPTGNFQATAELALGLLFSAARKIPFATEGARQGKWLKKEIGESGRQLSGSTLGIFGAGNIGMRLAKMAQGIGMKVIICDPFFKPAPDKPYEQVDFAGLLAKSDFVSIHAPFMDSTKHAFNIDAFRKMKPSAIIVNAARGGIIKDDDLVRALEENCIAGAALDVFETEPYPVDNPVYAKLIKDTRVVITPHLGASTIESQKLVSIESAEKIAAAILAAQDSGKTAPKALNNPAQARLKLRM